MYGFPIDTFTHWLSLVIRMFWKIIDGYISYRDSSCCWTCGWISANKSAITVLSHHLAPVSSLAVSQQDTCPYWVQTRGECRLRLYCKPLLCCSSVVRSTSYQCITVAHIFLVCSSSKPSIVFGRHILHTKLSLNSEEIWRVGLALSCAWWKVQSSLPSLVRSDTSTSLNRRETFVGEDGFEWLEDPRVWVSRERKKLKNRNNLVLEHLISHILPWEKPLCFQKQFRKRGVCENKATAGKRVPWCFAQGLWEKCEAWMMWAMPHGIMWIFFVTYICIVVSPGVFLWSASIPDDNLSCLIPLICTKLIFV